MQSTQIIKLHRWMRWDRIEDVLSSCLRFLQAYLHVQHLAREQEPSIRVMVWQVCASCLALVHTILGTLILPSLNFVGFHDTLVILARFLASALASRMIILLQIDMIKLQADESSTIDDVGSSYQRSSYSLDRALEHIKSSTESLRPSRPAEIV